MRFFTEGKDQYMQMKRDPSSVRVEGLITRLIRDQDTPGVVKAERRLADLELGYIGRAAIAAAADTTSAAFQSLVCCFAAYPDVLKKAQEEAELVAGKKPPTGDMLGKLVYLRACISEVSEDSSMCPRGIMTTDRELRTGHSLAPRHGECTSSHAVSGRPVQRLYLPQWDHVHRQRLDHPP